MIAVQAAWIAFCVSHAALQSANQVADKQAPPLFDQLHSRLPQLRFGSLAEVLVYGQILLGFLLCTRCDRLVVTGAVMYLLRALCFWATIMPQPSANMGADSMFFLNRPGHDLMFSGHVASMVIVCHHASTFLRDSFKWLLPVLWINAAVASFLIIGARQHYSSDVLVAWLSATGIALQLARWLN